MEGIKYIFHGAFENDIGFIVFLFDERRNVWLLRLFVNFSQDLLIEGHGTVWDEHRNLEPGLSIQPSFTQPTCCFVQIICYSIHRIYILEVNFANS